MWNVDKSVGSGMMHIIRRTLTTDPLDMILIISLDLTKILPIKDEPYIYCTCWHPARPSSFNNPLSFINCCLTTNLPANIKRGNECNSATTKDVVDIFFESSSNKCNW